MGQMELYHFSEEPAIRVFEPRPPLARPEHEPLVWAVQSDLQALFLLPRECPRVCFWPIASTTEEDLARHWHNVSARMVIGIESGWVGRLRETTLYRYRMPEATFEPQGEGGGPGYWVSRSAVEPTAVEPVGDLMEAMLALGVELRVMPEIKTLWDSVRGSSLHWSGIRLRNVAGSWAG